MVSLEKLTSENLQEKVIDAEGLVLVEVGGRSCAPCVALRPLLHELISRYAGRVALYELDPEQEIEAADRWQIRGIPTVLLFARGQICERWVGVRPASVYAQSIDKLLAGT